MSIILLQCTHNYKLGMYSWVQCSWMAHLNLDFEIEQKKMKWHEFCMNYGFLRKSFIFNLEQEKIKKKALQIFCWLLVFMVEIILRIISRELHILWKKLVLCCCMSSCTGGENMFLTLCVIMYPEYNFVNFRWT